ncbi:MAG: glycerol kinase GlpK [Terriglobia bacterium]
MDRSYVLALDQGTTNSRALLFDRTWRVAGSASREFPQYYPQPGWVEHDAEEIWSSQWESAKRAISRVGAAPRQIAAIGITNQRETVLLWDRKTSKPLAPAVVWQCRRTAAECDRIRRDPFSRTLCRRTGLVPDAYFSATKIAWLLDHIPGARSLARRGRLACGTVDSWLIWKLTGGRAHLTDVSNASRTMLFNIRSLDWDDDLLRYFRVPRSILPAVKPSSGRFGETTLFGPGAEIPISGVAGDQQASLFGHRCLKPGSVKNTYGTGCFLLMNAGEEAPLSRTGLISTVAWQRDGTTTYALEGSVFIAGAAVQWLRDELKIIKTAAESESLALSVKDAGGVYFVPAFVGLGAPYWDAYARGTLVGLTRGSSRGHIARAALESIAYQSRDVLDCMIRDSGLKPRVLRVDGGAARNRFLCQFQADILGIPVEPAPLSESTALGAALFAGLASGFGKDERDLDKAIKRARPEKARRFEPQIGADRREELYGGWRRAVERAKGWAK